ncbi:MAG: CBS domain-containing protein [Candidatus Bathyarchaeota archaeon]|nr:CBS domain-containing protein [Candidatus Bathyarchaeota archaeon]
MGSQVKKYMTKEVITLDYDAKVTEAANLMAADKEYEGYVIILQKGKPKGIVTERDLVNKVIVGGLDPAKTSVSDIMSSPLVTVDPEDDLLKATQVMKEQNVRKLVVVRDEIIYGIITARIISQNVQDYVDRSIRDIVRWTASLGI